MNNLHLFILILVMAGITFLIRMIPFVFVRKKIKSRFINSILYYIPYAVLSAMTFPAIFLFSKNIIAATIGTVVAIGTAMAKRSLIVVAVCACLSMLATQYLMLLF